MTALLPVATNSMKGKGRVQPAGGLVVSGLVVLGLDLLLGAPGEVPTLGPLSEALKPKQLQSNILAGKWI